MKTIAHFETDFNTQSENLFTLSVLFKLRDEVPDFATVVFGCVVYDPQDRDRLLWHVKFDKAIFL